MAVKKRGGLGKGLDALIAPVSTSVPAQTSHQISKPAPEFEVSAPIRTPEPVIVEKIVEKIIEKTVPAETIIRIDEIEPNKSQPRKKFDEDALQELSDSIKMHGVIQPLIVQKSGEFYQLIAGERRWRAARLAGLKEVPVIIKDYSPAESIEIALIENIQREDLNPIEEALAYQHLINEFGLKQDEAAEKVAKSRTAVTNALRLLNLCDDVRDMIIEGMISSGHGRALLAIEDKETQYQVALKIFDNKMSVRETERFVKTFLKEKSEKPKPDVQQQLAYNEIENKIKTIIGSKVSIKSKNNKKGKIEIEYYSTDDLERIIGLLETIK